MLPDLFTRTHSMPSVRAADAFPTEDPRPFGAVYAIDEPVSIISPVVFASPHSGRSYPEAFLEGCSADLLDMRRIEDAYVDRLLARVPASGAPVLCGTIGRACVDLNRSDTELDREMYQDPPSHWGNRRSARVAAGLGCIPRVAFNGTPIYRRKLKAEEADQRIEHIYRPYHQALEALLRRSAAMFGKAWLIDCHSMPSDKSANAPDIVLGDRFGGSCSDELSYFAESWFRDRGYKTVRNTPYAGGFATVSHGDPGQNREALQIEIRRSLYMDEARVEPHDGLVELRAAMAEFAIDVCGFTRKSAGLPVSSRQKKAAP